MHGTSLRYVALLVVQSLCAFFILYYVQEMFRVLIVNIGIPQAIPASILVQIAIAAVIAQTCYWLRLRTTPVPNGYRSILAGHVFAFASRLLFIFGGALFSLYFLRHLPAMQPGVIELGFIWRVICLIAILFVLYCYTLELERLGAALQAPPAGPENRGEAG